MVLRLVLPMMVALVAAFGAAWVQRRLRPDWATWTLTVLSGGAALAVLWALTVLAAGFAAEQPGLSGAFGWCVALFSSHDRIPAPVGIGAWAALIASGVSVTACIRARRAALRMTHDDIVGSNEPVAFAVPGRPGRVIVSEGMLDLLDSAEQRVLYAHEHSHLRHHHHRFLHVADAAAAAVPLLAPLNRQVRFATERWADEDAVDEVGDRRLVARAVARAAVASSTSGVEPAALSINGSGARARVEALMQPPGGPTAATLAWVSLGLTGLVVSVASSTVQFHHLVAFLSHICGLD